jgi:hypothetical protein
MQNIYTKKHSVQQLQLHQYSIVGDNVGVFWPSLRLLEELLPSGGSDGDWTGRRVAAQFPER